MGRISVISYGEYDFSHLSDNGILTISNVLSRRKLRRYILRNTISKAVVKGDVPDFVFPELSKLNVSLCTGGEFVKAIYPKLISRVAKVSGDINICTVYDNVADGFTLDVIKCAASYFRYVALCTPENADFIAEEIMEDTGLSLKFGDMGGVKILCRGNMEKTPELSLNKNCTVTFCDEKNRIISSDIAEAMAENDFSGDLLARLNLKIHSLC